MDNEDLIHQIVHEWFEVIYDAHASGMYGAELGITFYDRNLIEEDFDFVVFMAASFSRTLIEDGYKVYGLPGWVSSLDWDSDTNTWTLAKENGFEIAESFISQRDYPEYLTCAGLKMIVEWDEDLPMLQQLNSYDKALQEFIKTMDFEPLYRLLEELEEGYEEDEEGDD